MKNVLNKKRNIKKTVSILLSVIIAIVFILFFLLRSVNNFFMNNYFIFRPPVMFQTPLLIQQRKLLNPVSTASATIKSDNPMEIIFSYANGLILWKIYGLESSFGKNDFCKKYGKFNGFGYSQSDYDWKCYNSLDEVASKVDKWLSDKLSHYTLAQALCLYNTGSPVDNCEYYRDFKNL